MEDCLHTAIMGGDSLDILTELSPSVVGRLQREAPTPLYYQLYTLLKQAIIDGRVVNGSRMPTEQQLAESFDVSRITAKRAMDELAGEALVERRRGKGSHVTYEYQPKPVQAPLIGMLQEIESMARHSTVRVMSCRQGKPPAAIAEVLGLKGGGKALFLARVRSRDRQPFGHYASWTAGLSGVSKSDFRSTPRLEIFRRHGIALTHVTQTISAEAASDELAERLEMRPGAPLISLLRHSYVTRKGKEQIVDILHAHYHPERFQYRMDLRLDR